MKINSRFLIGFVSLILAVLIAFVAIPTIVSKTNGKTTIIRVTQPILRGSKITNKDIAMVEVGGFNLPVNIAREKSDVVGKYALADLTAGDYILSSKVSLIPITSDVELNRIPSGHMAVSFTIKTLASGLSDKLQNGDIIRIYHYKDSVQALPELKFVKVLSITDPKGINVDNTKEPGENEEKQQSATVTVLATPQQAEIITGLENDGIIHVALISRNNQKLAENLLKSQDQILNELYPAENQTAAEAENAPLSENGGI